MGQDTIEKAEKLLPKELKNALALEQMASDIRANIDAARTSVDTLKGQRKIQSDLYSGKERPPSKDTRGDQMEVIQMPLAKQRIDQRAANLAQSVVMPDPIFSYGGLGGRRRFESLERILQFSLSCINVEDIITRIVRKMMVKNTALIRVSFEDLPHGHKDVVVTGPYIGPMWRIIDPDDFVCSPNLEAAFEDLVTHGHRYDELLITIKAKQTSGEYLKADAQKPVSEGREDAGEKDGDKQTPELTESRSSATTTVYDVLHRHVIDKDKGKTILVRVKMTHTGTVLRVERWENPDSPYVIVQDHDGEDGAFAETGPGYDTLMLQKVANRILWQVLTNLRKGVRPQKMFKGGIIPSDLAGKEDDEFIPVPDPDSVVTVDVPNMIGDSLQVLQFIMGLADSASNTSTTLTGGPSLVENRTATAENIKREGFQSAVGFDVLKFGPALCRAARLTLYYLEKYWSIYRDHYKADLEAYSDGEQDLLSPDFSARGVITITGQTPTDLPETQAQQTTQIISMAQLVGDMSTSIQLRIQLLKNLIEYSRLEQKEELLASLANLEAEAADKLQWAQVMDQMQRQMAMSQFQGQMQMQQAQANGLVPNTPQPGVAQGSAAPALPQGPA